MEGEVKCQREETNKLFIHVSRNIDKNVRKSLTSKSSQYTFDGYKRHSCLLDIVLEGDKLSGNPNAMNLNS